MTIATHTTFAMKRPSMGVIGTLRAGLLALLCAWSAAGAQDQPQSATTLNFRDVDLAQVVEVVAAVTGKKFIIDPRVRAQVTIISSTPMAPDQLYETFLSSLFQTHVENHVQRRNGVPRTR